MAGDMVSTVTIPKTNNTSYSSQRSSNIYNNAAVDAAVDTYASHILRMYSPPQSNIDSSLGPYVCSILRNSTTKHQNQHFCYKYLEEVPEADSLLELLEEHCGMGLDEAKNALWIIITSVQTGVVDKTFAKSTGGNHTLFASSDTTEDTTISHEDYEMINSISQMIDEVVIDDDNTGHNYPSPSQSEDSRYGYLKKCNYYGEDGHVSNASTLIPTDLLAVMDGDVTEPLNGNYDVGTLTSDYDLKQVKDASKHVTAQDLAASLFRPSRSRSNSMLNEPSQPSTTEQSALSTSQQMYQPTINQNQIDSVVEILLSMNSALSEEAALAASMLVKYDVNLAQYVIETAMNAPPVCRHMLNEGCYRSDCQFNHDVDGNTCLFWLRGRCGKAHKCRFLHGFSENLLQGIDFEAETAPSYMSTNNINTTNLVQHNNMISKVKYDTYKSQSHKWKSEAFDSSSPYTSYSKKDQYSNNLERFYSSSAPSQTSSFASVASKGYNDSFSFTSPKENSVSTPSIKYARIPQNLWNPNHNRDASLFHIADPLERFKEVTISNKNNRIDVIDLHFQSIKTFPVVLNAILPERLLNCNEGVWVVTGSGHHVNRSSHQKSGGVLEKAVQLWLEENGYTFLQGKDKNGYGGAVLVKSFHS